MHEFRMPDIGEGLTEAEIVQWHVEVGDAVAVDQIIVEVETAKTVVEIPSVFAGTLLSRVGTPGTIVAVGDVLFTIGDGGEPISPAPAEGEAPVPVLAPAPQEASRSSSQVQDSPAVQIVADRPAPQDGSAEEGRPSSVRAMPLVRRLAVEKGIDLGAITGTGPGGAITRADVEGAQPAPAIDGELVPLTPMRRSIAEHMARSWREIPHVTVQAEVRAESLLGEIKEAGIALEACVARRILPVLKAFPEFNAAFTDQGVIHRTRYDLGFAVDTEAGLMVVVVRDADDHTVDALSEEFRALAQSAQDRTIQIDQITGQTFTISNIGALGGGHGTPIIPIGTTAILSVGRAQQQPVVEDGALTIGVVAPIDLSYDHRVIDGGLGQRFLSAVVGALEG